MLSLFGIMTLWTTLSVPVCESLGKKKIIPEDSLTNKQKYNVYIYIYVCVCVCVCLCVCKTKGNRANCT